MKRQTFVYFVCSPSPRVGSTIVARLLGDYFLSQRRAFAGFDTDAHERNFANSFPVEARVTDLSAIQGQITLFDNLLVDDEIPKIIDVWNRAFPRLFSIVREVGFFEEARRLMIEPIVLYVVDDTPECLETARQLKRQWPDLSMTLVNNEGAFALGADVHDILAKYPTERSFLIPPLDPAMRRVIDKSSFSFSRFLLAPPSDMSIVVRTALRAWLSCVYAQFKTFEIRVALDNTNYLR